MQFMNHAVAMTFIAKPLMNPILVFRMVKMSIEHGICNISAFAFACYGAWLVSDPDTCDVEGAHSMGRVATEMMKRLGAVEVSCTNFDDTMRKSQMFSDQTIYFN